MTLYILLMIVKNLFIFICGISLGVLVLSFIQNRKNARYEVPMFFIYLTGFLSFVAVFECIYINLP